MTATINLTNASLLIITLSAVAYASGNGSLVIFARALVDSTQANPVSDNIAFYDYQYTEQRSMTFFQNMPAGNHTIHIQWRTAVTAVTAALTERTLTVTAIPS
jgi:hypothetical protein